MLSSLKQPRTYVKFAVSQAYYATCTTISTAAILAVVEPEPESSTEDYVELAGFTIGSMVWWKTRDHVVAVVDKLADRRIARKEAKKTAVAAA